MLKNKFIEIAKLKACLKESWYITWPILVIMLFGLVMNMTDVYIAGLVGKTTQAAIGMANQTLYIFTVVIQAVSVGTIAVISRIFGSKNRQKDLPSAIYTAVLFSFVCSLLISAIAIGAGTVVIDKMNATPELKQQTSVLLEIYCAGLFFNLMQICFNSILRACRLMRYSMAVMAGAAVLNLILSVITVFYTPIGYPGIAIATAVCWFLSCAAILPVIVKLAYGEKSFSKDIIKKIFNIGWPSGIIAFSWQISSLAIYGIVGMLPENNIEVMAALTAGLRIEAIIFMPAFAFNMANAVLIGNLLGEGKKDEAFTMGAVTALTGVLLILVLTMVVIVSAKPIALVLASKGADGSTDPVVMSEMVKYLRMVMISEPFMALNLIIGGALSGAGDTKALMRYTLFSLWILRMPLAYIFAIKLGFGATAIWWAMNITFLSQSFLSSRRYLSKKWFAL